MPLQKTFGHSYNKNKSNEIVPLATLKKIGCVKISLFNRQNIIITNLYNRTTLYFYFILFQFLTNNIFQMFCY
jgi:hypothetical protein